MAGSMPPLRSNSPRGVFAISKGMMGLDSFPDVIGPDAAARRAQVLTSGGFVNRVTENPRVPPSPRRSPRTGRGAHLALLPPRCSPHDCSESGPSQRSADLDTVEGLERYLADGISRLPRGSVERLQGYRHVFTSLITQLPAHGPLLSEVKQEYEMVLCGLAERSVGVPSEWSSRATPRVHPLQLPAHYYASELARCQQMLVEARKQADEWRAIAMELRRDRCHTQRRLFAAGYALAEDDEPAPADTHVDETHGDTQRSARGGETEASSLDAAALRSEGNLKAADEMSAYWQQLQLEFELAQKKELELHQAQASIDAEAKAYERQLAALELRLKEAGEEAVRLRRGATAARRISEQLLTELDASYANLMMTLAVVNRAPTPSKLAEHAADMQTALREASEESKRQNGATRTLQKLLRTQEEGMRRAARLLEGSRFANATQVLTAATKAPEVKKPSTPRSS